MCGSYKKSKILVSFISYPELIMSTPCQTCRQPIDPDRVSWAESKGYTVKYCRSCSEAKKEQRQNVSRADPQQGRMTKEEWNEIGVSKIIHNFMRDAYNQGKTPAESAEIVRDLYKKQKEVVNDLTGKGRMRTVSPEEAPPDAYRGDY